MQLRAKRSSARCGEGGFTYLETLVVGLLGIIVLLAVGKFHDVQLHSVRSQALQNEIQMDARGALQLFTREVRGAGANPTCAAGISAIVDARSTLLRIQSDVNGDGALGGAGEDVTYEYKLDSNRFDRTDGGPSEALLDGDALAGSRIRYYDAAGTELDATTGLSAAARASVRRVRIELVAASMPGELADGARARVAVANDVDLRNRYFANPISCP